MGLLIPLVHPARVAGPDAAAELVRALGATRVRMTQWNVRGWVVEDAPAIARVLAAIEPGSHSTIAFECITREATLPALADLAVADAEFLHVHGTTTALRVWPRRDEAYVGALRVGRDQAFARFRDACSDAFIDGYVVAPGADALDALARAVAEVDQPEFDFDLDLTLDTAVALVRAHATDELQWTGGDAIVQFPHGEISTFRLAPVAAETEQAWRATIDAALART